MATFCLIHGAWHGPSCWDQLVPPLVERGHGVVVPDLPLHDPEAGYDERIRPAVEDLKHIDAPVVIVGHSQGTAYSSLLAAVRPDSVLVHLCPRLGGFEPPPGAPAPFREGFPFPPDRPDGTSVWDERAALDAMYPRLPPATAAALARRLRPMAMPDDPYPLHSHPDNPTVVIYAAEDEFFEPAWERFMSRRLVGVEPIEIPGGHFPMAEDPEALAALLDRVAGI
ncbi:MAG TPA: alpha/beta hydrolase [Solirubrobacterales bacterium]|nr:alpha/beta hydrolase [Solirubrobacterales bacterium]